MGPGFLRLGNSGPCVIMGNMKEFWNKHKGNLSAAMAIVLLYVVFFVTHIGCPIKFLTGVSCAGCGMTRAWWYLLHGDIHRAVYYHPLFWLPICATFVILLRKRFSKKIYYGLIGLMCALALGVWLYRFSIPNQDIVVFQPQVGFIGRMIRVILGLLKN